MTVSVCSQLYGASSAAYERGVRGALNLFLTPTSHIAVSSGNCRTTIINVEFHSCNPFLLWNYSANEMASAWDSHKGTIVRLYTNPQTTLDDVMRVMKNDFGFSPRLVLAIYAYLYSKAKGEIWERMVDVV